ncbi:MAG: BamA/TamA family outer membrane protein [Selenomonadaceae bacterium]|nr:BamA/TamA family outer membrane protein [Selenomonadaceae bacterium]
MSAIEKFKGRTVAELNVLGGSDETRPTARAAISAREGDSLSVDMVGKDASAIMETGYFVDVYPTFKEVPEGVILTYHLQEYPKFNGIKFVGNKMVKTEDLEKKITLKPGERYNSVVFHKNMEDIEGIYKKDGYIQARIVDMRRVENGVIEVKINEGILEGYRVKGNTKTKERVILREMRQKPGEPFNANKAKRSFQRVNNLGIFEDVHTRLVPGVEPNSVVMEIEVKEKRTGTFGIGAGYSSQDGALGMVSLSDTNFRGTGDFISIVYEVSGDDRDARGYSFTYKRPWLDKRETAGTLRLYNRTYQYNDYDTNGNLKEEYMRKYSGGEVTFSRPMSEYSTNYVTIRNRKDRYIKHITTGNVPDRSGEYGKDWRSKNFGTTRSVIFQHITDTRDNIYEPTSGGKVSLTGEIAGFGGGFNFKKASIEDARFRKVGRAQVLATRLAYGVGQGDISEFNQFKVGGQDTLRGYRDDQFRGNRMFLGTLEYRFPLVSKVQGALFTDWGAAWNDGFKPQNFNGSVGIGLSFNTPLGPLRLDYGRGKNGGRVHFTIGGMF